ncbi:MAG: hypothetical protein ACI9WC_002866 [Arenicella sp.]|jgi:hypothetical protein
MLRDVKCLLFLLVFSMNWPVSGVTAKESTLCELPIQQTFRKNLIELGDLACDDFLDCVLILNFPKQYQNTQFKKISLMPDKDTNAIMPNLLTSEVKNHLSSYLYGSQDFLTSLRFRIVYEPIEGCSFWSTLVLE